MKFIKFKLVKGEEEKPIKVIKIGRSKDRVKKEKHPKIKRTGKKCFVLNWEQEIGYNDNPFTHKILEPVSDFIGGYEKERDKINLFIINNQRFGTITGQEGVGKTTLLKWLYEQLQQYEDKILVNYVTGRALSKDFTFIKSIVNPLLSMYEEKVKKLNEDVDIERNLSILKRKLGHKRLVLLMDDVIFLPEKVLALIRKMYGIMPMQIIMASSTAQMLRKIDWKDNLKIELKGMPPKDFKLMMKKRIEKVGGDGIFPFEDKDIQSICKKAAHNPKQILFLCESYAKQLSVRQINVRREKKEKEDVIKEKKEEVRKEEIKKEEEKEEEHSIDVPELKEIEKKDEYKISVVNQGSDAIYVDHKDKDYKVHHVKKK